MIEMIGSNFFKFAVLDPRNIPAANETNEKLFVSGKVYGIEVTIPALANRCVYNLDPQHGGENSNLAAIEAAVTTKAIPDEGITLATVRADLDSVGAMAIFYLRSLGQRQYGSNEWLYLFGTAFLPDPKGTVKRIQLVAESDRFARGGWPGPRPLPTRGNPWPDVGSVEGTQSLAAIAAAVADFKVPLETRVDTMQKWLLTGEEPDQYKVQVEKERLDMINALETGQIKVETRAGGRIAVVESTHRAATSVGYSLAPVVVALNPAFRFAGGEPHRKFTISAFEQKYADIKGALTELAALEPGWGGSPTIGGSPQGVTSKLTIDQVVSVMEKHLCSEPGDRLCNCGAAKVMEPHEWTPYCG